MNFLKKPIDTVKSVKESIAKFFEKVAATESFKRFVIVMRKFKQIFAEHSAFFALALLFVLAVILEGTTFLNVNNIMNILMNNAIVGIIALGMTLIIISGGIDLAVGAQLASTGLIAITVMNHTHSIVLGIVVAIVAGVAMGFVTGVLIAKFQIPAFITTLGMMQIFRSVAQHFFSGGGILVDRDYVGGFLTISNTRILNTENFPGIPLPVIYWFSLCLIIHVIATRTAFGRHIYAVGSNERAARLSGINVDWVKIGVYMTSGALVVLASIVEASRLGSMNSSASGGAYELQAIAAVVIGGTAMSGGKGKISGTLFGMLTLGIINNMMNLMGFPSFLVAAIQGGIILLAVLLQRSVTTKEKKY